jgi:capping protein beta
MEDHESKQLDDKLNSALNLMRRMPPSSTENSLAGLLALQPELTDELLTHVDQPLKEEKDTFEDKKFLKCDYNRDGDSYRSPWSNTYFPPMDDGFKPNKMLRELEIAANQLFSVYRKLYFTTGSSSAYFFETDDSEEENSGFGATFLIHKKVDKDDQDLQEGIWDSIHVFEVIPTDEEYKFCYKLTTTVMIAMRLVNGKTFGSADLSGLRTQQHENTCALKNKKYLDHITNMGKMLEDCETRIRNEIESIYIQKTRNVIDGMRGGNNKRDQQWGDITASLAKSQFHRKE